MRIKPERNKRIYEKDKIHTWKHISIDDRALGAASSSVGRRTHFRTVYQMSFTAVRIRHLPERETKTNPFYKPENFTLRRRSSHRNILCHYVYCAYKYGDKTFLCRRAFHFNYAQYSILFRCLLRETWVAHIHTYCTPPQHRMHVSRSALIQMFIQFLLGVKN